LLKSQSLLKRRPRQAATMFRKAVIAFAFVLLSKETRAESGGLRRSTPPVGEGSSLPPAAAASVSPDGAVPLDDLLKHSFHVSFSAGEDQPAAAFPGGPNCDGGYCVEGWGNKPQGEAGSSGTVLFLHGGGSNVRRYRDVWPRLGKLMPPGTDYKIIFLSAWISKSTDSMEWFRILDSSQKYPDITDRWNTHQMSDALRILEKIVEQVGSEMSDGKQLGFENVWMSGHSQGALLSAAFPLIGTQKLVKGSFSIASYPLPGRCDQSSPYLYDGGTRGCSGSAERPVGFNTEKLTALKMGFYTGTMDDQFPPSHSVAPDAVKTQVPAKADYSFPRWRVTLQKWQFDPSKGNVHFWFAPGRTHKDITWQDSSDAWFRALITFVQGKTSEIQAEAWPMWSPE